MLVIAFTTTSQEVAAKTRGHLRLQLWKLVTWKYLASRFTDHRKHKLPVQIILERADII